MCIWFSYFRKFICIRWIYRLEFNLTGHRRSHPVALLHSIVVFALFSASVRRCTRAGLGPPPLKSRTLSSTFEIEPTPFSPSLGLVVSWPFVSHGSEWPPMRSSGTPTAVVPCDRCVFGRWRPFAWAAPKLHRMQISMHYRWCTSDFHSNASCDLFTLPPPMHDSPTKTNENLVFLCGLFHFIKCSTSGSNDCNSYIRARSRRKYCRAITFRCRDVRRASRTPFDICFAYWVLVFRSCSTR